jgi:hypothetical protein
MTDATVPEYRCTAHDEKLLDHETRLRTVERDVDAAHDKVRELGVIVDAKFRILGYKLMAAAASGGFLAVAGERAAKALGLLP